MTIPRYPEIMAYVRAELFEDFDVHKFNRTQGAVGYLRKLSAREGDRVTVELIEASLPPLVAAVIDSPIPRRDPDLWDDLVQFSILALLRRLGRKQTFPLNGTFHHLRNFFLWRLMDGYRQMGPKVIQRVDDDWTVGYDSMSTKAHRDVENKIFFVQLQAEICYRVEKRIRFKGLKREACVYMLHKLLEVGEVALKPTAHLFSLEKPVFYRDYVLVLLRTELHQLRQKYRGVMAADWIQQVYA